MSGRAAAVASTFGVVAILMFSHPVLGWPTPGGYDSYAQRYGERGACTPGADWGVVDRLAETQVLGLIDAYRVRLGLRVLVTNPALTASAIWKSLHMGRFGYFNHADPAPPVARSPFERALDCGYVNSYIGEDIAEGQTNAQQAVQDWIASPDHRDVIENAQYSEIGIGVARSPGGRSYWTLDLGRGPL